MKIKATLLYFSLIPLPCLSWMSFQSLRLIRYFAAYSVQQGLKKRKYFKVTVQLNNVGKLWKKGCNLILSVSLSLRTLSLSLFFTWKATISIAKASHVLVFARCVFLLVSSIDCRAAVAWQEKWIKKCAW